MYRSLGNTYTIGTSIPLMPEVQVDVPVTQMANEAAPALAEAWRREIPWILVASLAVAFVGCAAANWIVPGRR